LSAARTSTQGGHKAGDLPARNAVCDLTLQVTLSDDMSMVAAVRGRFKDSSWSHAVSLAILYVREHKRLLSIEKEVSQPHPTPPNPTPTGAQQD
jgi:hypothetical protein